MLLTKGKITKEMIRMLSSWRHSGFHVFCGNRISPDEETAMENLARYIIRASGGEGGLFRKPAGIGTCPRNEESGSGGEGRLYIQDAIPSIIESQGDEKIFRRNWARLIQKIEVDLHLQSHADDFCGDPDYSWDEYIQS